MFVSFQKLIKQMFANKYGRMDIVMILMILICFIIRINTHDLEILGSGLVKPKKNDMLLQMFITLRHHGHQAVNVFASTVECCENISEDNLDCESFRLFEDYVRISPGTSKNLTLIHPNIYIYDRKGSCLISIWQRIAQEEKPEDKPTVVRHRIQFDTTVSPEAAPPSLVGFYDPKKITRCETKDLDPFDMCNPVNCLIKYSGFRNYFNAKRKICQKVPICVGDPKKELADVVYVPSSNICRDLEKMSDIGDLSTLLKESSKYIKYDLDSIPVNIQCHHGETDVRTGLCICDKGWKSEIFDPDSPIFHMCNTPCAHTAQKKMPLVPLLVGLFVAVLMTLCICFCEKYNFACQFMRKVVFASGESCTCLQNMNS